VIDVEGWSGREAHWLRRALRMSQRDFAAYLGVSERTVAKWDSRGAEIRPRDEYQRALDTALAQASVEARERFRAIREGDAATPERHGFEAAPNSSRGSVTRTSLTSPDTRPDIDTFEFYERLMVDYAAFDNSAGPNPSSR